MDGMLSTGPTKLNFFLQILTIFYSHRFFFTTVQDILIAMATFFLSVDRESEEENMGKLTDTSL